MKDFSRLNSRNGEVTRLTFPSFVLIVLEVVIDQYIAHRVTEITQFFTELRAQKLLPCKV